MSPETRSKPTMCLHCHLIVSMTLRADERGDFWECQTGHHQYRIAHWKIKPETKPRKKVAPILLKENA